MLEGTLRVKLVHLKGTVDNVTTKELTVRVSDKPTRETLLRAGRSHQVTQDASKRQLFPDLFPTRFKGYS